MATRLLPRYGYLTAEPNPASSMAREQGLILKERVRRYVALEAERDSKALRPQRPEDVERASWQDQLQVPESVPSVIDVEPIR